MELAVRIQNKEPFLLLYFSIHMESTMLSNVFTLFAFFKIALIFNILFFNDRIDIFRCDFFFFFNKIDWLITN